MTWLAVRALLARVPGIVWVALLVVTLAVAGLAFTYASGQRAGERRVRQQAVHDSVTHAVEQVQKSTDSTEKVRRFATTAKRWADTSRTKREKLREDVEPLLKDLPEPVVALIRHDDKQITRDSVAIDLYVAADTAWVAERRARVEVDTLQAHELALGTEPPKHHRALIVLAKVGLVAAVVGGLVAAAR